MERLVSICSGVFNEVESSYEFSSVISTLSSVGWARERERERERGREGRKD